jgi:hypothetical protein
VSRDEGFEDRLVPVLREAVNVVKMIFFINLKSLLEQQHPPRPPAYVARLTGAVLNELFGTPSTEEPFKTFAEDNRPAVDEALQGIAGSFDKLRIPLTDALRIQFLCDSREGIDSHAVLSRARDLGVLIVDREIPLPKTFMNQVRRLGVAYNLLVPVEIPEEPILKGRCKTS